MAILFFGLGTIIYGVIAFLYAVDDNMIMFAFYVAMTCVWATLTGLYATLRR